MTNFIKNIEIDAPYRYRLMKEYDLYASISTFPKDSEDIPLILSAIKEEKLISRDIKNTDKTTIGIVSKVLYKEEYYNIESLLFKNIEMVYKYIDDNG